MGAFSLIVVINLLNRKMIASKSYKLKRIEKKLFADADVFVQKIYGGYYGANLWPGIRSALQQPEKKLSLTYDRNKLFPGASRTRTDSKVHVNKSDAIDEMKYSAFEELKRDFELIGFDIKTAVGSILLG